MNIFVAGASSQRVLIHIAICYLQALGHECFDWTQHPGFEDEENFSPYSIALEDITEVQKADALIWVIGDPSHGAPFEAGHAFALGKPVIVLWADGKPQRNSIYGHLLPCASTLSDAVTWIERAVGLRKIELSGGSWRIKEGGQDV